MLRKKPSDLRDADLEYAGAEAVPSPLRSLPLVLVVLTVVGFIMYAGRQEIFEAVGGARAYMVTSVLESQMADSDLDNPANQMSDLVVNDIDTDTAAPTGNSKTEATPITTTTTSQVSATTAPAGTYKVITEVTLPNNTIFKILDEPLPADCYSEAHADYDGFAVKWGLGNKARSAAECCRMCKEFQATADIPHRCNVWVWCGDPSGKCWTMDIHKHMTGDCWLKYQAGWDNNPDRKATNLKVNHRYRFSDEFRKEHKSAPELVPWIAGVVPKPTTQPAAGAGRRK